MHMSMEVWSMDVCVGYHFLPDILSLPLYSELSSWLNCPAGSSGDSVSAPCTRVIDMHNPVQL